MRVYRSSGLWRPVGVHDWPSPVRSAAGVFQLRAWLRRDTVETQLASNQNAHSPGSARVSGLIFWRALRLVLLGISKFAGNFFDDFGPQLCQYAVHNTGNRPGVGDGSLFRGSRGDG